MSLYPNTEDDLFAPQHRSRRRGGPFVLLTVLTGVIAVILLSFGVLLILQFNVSAQESSQTTPDVSHFVVVPNFVGMSFEEAQRTAEAQGFKIDVVNAYTDGKVARQAPRPGAHVAQGSTILVDFALTSPPSKVSKGH